MSSGDALCKVNGGQPSTAIRVNLNPGRAGAVAVQAKQRRSPRLCPVADFVLRFSRIE
jgi:hypothetical protein